MRSVFKPLTRISLLVGVLLVGGPHFGLVASAQVKNYVSTVDESVTVRKVLVVPLFDNVKGIYSQALSPFIEQVIEQDRQWSLVKAKGLSATNPDFLEESPDQVKKLLTAHKVDAILSSRILKGPAGLTLKLSLLGGPDGQPFLHQKLENTPSFEIIELRRRFLEMFQAIKKDLPYQGTITSRQGELITVDFGALHGAREGEEVLAVLVTKLERHPRFQFITRSEREILGKIKLTKVEPSVSFATVVSERTAALLQPGFKLTREKGITYAAIVAQDGQLATRLEQRGDATVAFGQNPGEWVPVQEGSFGRLGFLLGFTQVGLESTDSAGGSGSSQNTFTPSVKMEGELWIDPHWQITAEFGQVSGRVTNGKAGSSPNPLSFQMQKVSGHLGYNFLAEEEFFGPKFHLLAGMTKYATFIDDSSPRAHTGKDYSAVSFGLGGSLPFELESRKRVTVGGRFIYSWKPTLSESPSSGGSSTNLVSDFLFFAEYGFSTRLSFRGNLEFSQISSSFSGGTFNSASGNFVGLLGGVSYTF